MLEDDYFNTIAASELVDTNSPELELWRAVVRQIVEDFQKSKDKKTLEKDNYNRLVTKREKLERQQHKLWHELNSEWFKEICLIIDVDHGKVKTACGKIYSGRYVLYLGRLSSVDLDS